MFASNSIGHPNFAHGAIDAEASGSRADPRRDAAWHALAAPPSWVLDLLRREPVMSSADLRLSKTPGGMKPSSALKELRALSDLVDWMVRANPNSTRQALAQRCADLEQRVRRELSPHRACASDVDNGARHVDPARSASMLPRYLFCMLLDLARDTKAEGKAYLTEEPAPFEVTLRSTEPIAMSGAPCERPLPRPVAVAGVARRRLTDLAKLLFHLEALYDSVLDPEAVSDPSRDLLDQAHGLLRAAWSCHRSGDRTGASHNTTRARELCGEVLSYCRTRDAQRPNRLDPREISYPPDPSPAGSEASRIPRRDV